MSSSLSFGRVSVFSLAAAGLLAIAASSIDIWPTRLVYNASASVPIGWYAIAPADVVEPGDLVISRPTPHVETLLVTRGYLGAGVPFVKQVAAGPGATICRHGTRISVDGTAVGSAREADARSRPLPRWSGCRVLRPGELFLFSAAPGSFDGRYLGPTSRRDIIGKARPLWTW